jgi:predicted Zn-dependent protease
LFQTIPAAKNAAELAASVLPSNNPLGALQELAQWEAQEQDNQQAFRWPLDKMPLSVWMDPHPSAPQSAGAFVTETLENGLLLAIKQWETASQGLVQFHFLDNHIHQREQADILITWSGETVQGRDYEVGHTNRDVHGALIRHVTITLITQPRIDAHLSPQHRKQRLYTTVLHEAGHALGLEHSELETDVMHHRGWQRSQLSNNDVQRLKTLYSKGQYRY